MMRVLGRLIAVAALASTLAAAEAPYHWTYEGEEGPQHWADRDPANRACRGEQQSPIDLAGAIPSRTGHLGFGWSTVKGKLTNNGHTLQVTPSSAGGLTIGGVPYTLKQFHFHTPSEHAIGGVRSAMEVHFVHANASGGLAVIGVLLKPGRANPSFHAVMAAAAGAPLPTLDLRTLLPKRRASFEYEGSLTTPPCTETVEWHVLVTPVEVAQADIDEFHRIFAENARPLQPRNRRFLLSIAR